MRALIILLLLGSPTAKYAALEVGIAAHNVGAESRWTGPDGELLPFRGDAEVEHFLRDADVVSEKVLAKGITNARKVLLEKDGVRAHAVFRAVNVRHREPGASFSETFRDSCLFEVAAYRVDRFLGLNRVPPVVERTHRGQRGSLQIWVENAFDEQARRERGLTPPSLERWRRQQALRRIFDALIYNHDRNLGNVLIDARWNFWLIDHTRSFKPASGLRDAKRITRCARDLWQRLQSADRARLARALDPYLTPQELRTVFVRWDKLLEHFGVLIAERGESEILF